MERDKIRDVERELRRLGITGIVIGLILLSVNLAILMLIPDPMPFRVLSSLIGTIVLLQSVLCLISARRLARQTVLPTPTRFSSWFTKKRNFILTIILSIILPIVVFLIIKAIT